MEAGGLVGVVELLDGCGGVGVADGFVAQALQDGGGCFPIANPLPDTLFLSFVHYCILSYSASCCYPNPASLTMPPDTFLSCILRARCELVFALFA